MGYRYEPTAFADGSVILPFSDVDMDKVKEDFRKRIARRRKRLEMSQKRIKALRAAAASKPASDSEDMDELSDHSVAKVIELSDGDDDGDDEPEDAQGDDEEDVAEDDNNAQPQQMLQPPHIIPKKPSKLTSTPESTTRTSPELATPIPTAAAANRRRSHMHSHTQAPSSQPKPAKRGRPPLASNRYKPPPARQQNKRKQANSSPAASACTPDRLPAYQLQDSLNDEPTDIQDIVRDMEEVQEEYRVFKSLVRIA
ncbi:hypothetical protein GGF42_003001, partial [Coemansia sp. RSA 2424]